MTQKTIANPTLIKVALLIGHLMNLDEQTVLIGRHNWTHDDYETGYIIVEQLGTSQTISTSEEFNENDEIMSYETMRSTQITIEFYGDTAYDNSRLLTGLLRSQKAFEKKQSLGIDVLRVSSVTDIKQLTGQQYGNRLQVSAIVQDNQTVNVATLRIDTPQYRFLTEDKEIIK